MIIPINVDLNATLSNFQNSSNLYITSIFYTIQGEGPYTGCPCIFIRLAGCNYGSKTKVCTQCDTSFQLKNATQYSVDQLIKEIGMDASEKYAKVINPSVYFELATGNFGKEQLP